jgi:hypothetical protein
MKSIEKEGFVLKRRIFALALCLCLVLGLPLTARADSAASSIQIYASVNEDGEADITMTVRLRIEEAADSLYFPLPLEATDIKLNDRGVNSTRGTSSIQVRLDNDIAQHVGDHVLTFKYKIPDVVRMVEDEQAKKNRLTLILPLLSGFEYPVGSVSLTVMLPEAIEGRPVFKSTYHQDDIDKILSVTVSNNMITGLITHQLKDHETLSMTMVVPETMFDGVSTYVRIGNPEVIPMVICGVLALVYWLIFLRCYPLLRERRNSPPEGITAGELGPRLTMAGADLTAMVLSWAQMGYLTIQLDDRGRVWLHKKMNMGNERNAFEVKTFQTLFGRRDILDGTGARYAAVARKLSRLNPARKIMSHPKCGNMLIFRGLMTAVQLICGVCFAMNLSGKIAFQVLLVIVLGALGAVSGWLIQSGMYRLHLRFKLPLILSLVVSLLWIGLGIWAGQWLIGLCSVLAQLLAGLMAAYGGRRSGLGRQNATQILGLRHYFKTVERAELVRIQENDPEYFYNLLPYAMALGVEVPFARRFGKQKMAPCPYFSCGVHTSLTAEDWTRFFRETVQILDERWRREEIEQYAAIWLKR